MRIASLLVSVAALLAIPACGKSTCEKYADMEVKCGHYPADEKQITHDLAQGFCMAADSDEPGAQEMAAQFKAEAECAKKTSDCVEYKACTDAIK
jgi:hypothetical protein